MPKTREIPLTQLPGPVLVLGAAYSGKSELAMQLVAPDRPALVLGTAVAGDPALDQRVRELRRLRPAAWETIESGDDLPAALAQAGNRTSQLLVDSLSQWLARLVVGGGLAGDIRQEEALATELDTRVAELLRVVRELPAASRCVLVSAEVGAGPAPARAAERHYRRAVGLLNRQLAEIARSVLVVHAGIPLQLK